MKVNSHFVAQSIEVLKRLQDRPFDQKFGDIYKGCNPLIEGTDEDIENFKNVVRKLKNGARRKDDLDHIDGWKEMFFDIEDGAYKDFFDLLDELKSIAYFRLKDKGRSDFDEEILEEVFPPSLKMFYLFAVETETFLHPIHNYLKAVKRFFRAEYAYFAALKKIDEIDVEATTQAFRKLEEEVN